MREMRKVVGALLVVALGVVVLGPTLFARDTESKTTSEDARWILGDAEVVMKLNIKQLMSSDLMKKGGIDAIKQQIESNEQAKAILQGLNLDITKDVDSLLISGAGATKGNPKDAKAWVIVRGRFDTDKVAESLKKRSDIKVSKEGATSIYEIPVKAGGDEQQMYAAFADKNTLVMTQNKASTVDVVKTGGKRPATLSKEMAKALDRFSGKESMTMALVINEDMRKAIAKAPRVGDPASKLQTLTAALTVTDTVAMNVTGITGDSKAATQLGKLLEGLKAAAALAGDDVPKPLLDLVDAVKVVADRDSVKVDLKVTKEMIEKATKGG